MVARDYLGFKLSGPGGTECNDGVVRRLQPDVEMVLDEMAAMDLPTAGIDASRGSARLLRPDVSELVRRVPTSARSSTACCPARQANWRTGCTGRRPRARTRSSCTSTAAAGLLGDATSDDPLCRDLCVRSDAIVISADYRHAPEHRFPAAVEDAMAAVRWVADNAEALGGIPGRLAVCGWSAGGNLAAVVCRLARDAADRHIVGQALLTPLTDGDMTRASYVENADGYGLTTALVRWLLRPLHRRRRSTRSPVRALARRRSVRAAACDRGHGRVRSPARRG